MSENAKPSGARAGRKQVPNLKLIGLLVNAGLSPRELANYINVSAPTIRQAESGQLPQIRVQKEIAEYFGVEVTEIWPVKVQAAVRRVRENAREEERV